MVDEAVGAVQADIEASARLRNERFDLNKLLDFAREHAVSFELYYSEPSDRLCLELIFAAESECMKFKGVPSVEYAIREWMKAQQPTTQRGSGSEK